MSLSQLTAQQRQQIFERLKKDTENRQKQQYEQQQSAQKIQDLPTQQGFSNQIMSPQDQVYQPNIKFNIQKQNPNNSIASNNILQISNEDKQNMLNKIISERKQQQLSNQKSPPQKLTKNNNNVNDIPDNTSSRNQFENWDQIVNKDAINQSSEILSQNLSTNLENYQQRLNDLLMKNQKIKENFQQQTGQFSQKREGQLQGLQTDNIHNIYSNLNNIGREIKIQRDLRQNFDKFQAVAEKEDNNYPQAYQNAINRKTQQNVAEHIKINEDVEQENDQADEYQIKQGPQEGGSLDNDEYDKYSEKSIRRYKQELLGSFQKEQQQRSRISAKLSNFGNRQQQQPLQRNQQDVVNSSVNRNNITSSLIFKENYSPTKQQYDFQNLRQNRSQSQQRNRQISLSTSKERETRNRSLEQYHDDTNFQFKPKINDMPKSVYKDYDQKKVEISKEEIWTRLLTTKTELQYRRDQLKLEKEGKSVQETCTFKPKINENSRIIAKTDQFNQLNMSIQEKLYYKGLQQLRNKEITQRDIQENKVQLNVQPIRELKGDKELQQPLYMRIDEIMKEKQKLKQNLAIQVQKEQISSNFQPAINKISQCIAEIKNQQAPDVTQRLLQDAAEKQNKKIKQAEEYHQELGKQYTFKPQINPISKNPEDLITESENQYYKANQDFTTRQYLLADELKDKKELKKKKLLEQENLTFKPQINQVSQYLVESNPKYNDENQEEKIHRLYKIDKEKNQFLKEQLDRQYYNYNYAPEINPVSKTIGRKRSLDSLAYNKEVEDLKKAKIEEKDKQNKQKFTYQPLRYTGSKYSNVEPKYKNKDILQNIEKEKQQKSKKIQKLQREQEYNELKNCTFKPIINKKEIIEDEYTVEHKVKGLNMVMQRRQMIIKKQEEQKRRESQVFNIEQKYQYGKPSKTTPLPFQLSKGNAKAIQQLKKDALDKHNEQCPFKPQTNEGAKRKLIQEIIQQSQQDEDNLDEQQDQEDEN